ncbi:rhodanese-like domain-containing protein [Planococcus halotolerans]|uniref:Rhodanese-like domain-containing protein n=1 Tax=Planococcus halotolerans TaxID=2233542 RepID=A0A365L6Q1_9BACL|nr:rhodanese-like domain-containing protein [Planococcus halotolerans]RAZ81094.1 rhodanese-like domain-containing protein [Planococcus halotolerans]
MKRMTAQEVQEYIKNNKDVSIIDVRETEEVKAGKIPGSVNIPLGLIEFRMHDIDKSQEHIMVCRSGSRSGMATNILVNHGYNAINMDGGMIDWDGPAE